MQSGRAGMPGGQREAALQLRRWRHGPARRRVAARVTPEAHPRRRRPSAAASSTCRARPPAVDRLGCEHLQPLGCRNLGLAPAAGRRVARAGGARLGRRRASSRAALGLVELGGVDDALLGLRHGGQHAVGERGDASTISRAASAARRVVQLAGGRRGADRERLSEQTGPVSRPSSIRKMLMPVSASPARMARWIGAAPRQRGSSEACRLRQPSRGARRGPAAAAAARRRRPRRDRRRAAANSACGPGRAASRGVRDRQAQALGRARPGRGGRAGPAGRPGRLGVDRDQAWPAGSASRLGSTNGRAHDHQPQREIRSRPCVPSNGPAPEPGDTDGHAACQARRFEAKVPASRPGSTGSRATRSRPTDRRRSASGALPGALGLGQPAQDHGRA